MKRKGNDGGDGLGRYHTVSGIQDHRPVEEHYEALGRVVSDQPSDYE